MNSEIFLNKFKILIKFLKINSLNKFKEHHHQNLKKYHKRFFIKINNKIH